MGKTFKDCGFKRDWRNKKIKKFKKRSPKSPKRPEQEYLDKNFDQDA